MKKRKNRKDYKIWYQKLFELSQTDYLNLGEDTSFDFWHIHPDNEYFRDINSESKEMHFRCLFALYRKGLDLGKQWKKPFQCWIIIDPENSIDDSVYFHTNNPNRDNFPYDFKGFKETDIFDGVLQNFNDEIDTLGKIEYNGYESYYVLPKIYLS